MIFYCIYDENIDITISGMKDNIENLMRPIENEIEVAKCELFRQTSVSEHIVTKLTPVKLNIFCMYRM